MHEYLKLTVFFVIILFVPGYLLSRLLLAKKEFSLCERMAVWFPLSVAILAIPGIAAYVFNLSFSALLAAIVIIIALLLLLNIQKAKGCPIEGNPASATDAGRRLPILSITIILMGLTLAALSGYIRSCFTRDALIFLAYIRKLAENPHISNHAAYYLENGIDPTYGYNVWHLILALLSNVSKIGPMQVWIFMPIILAPLIMLSFYVFARALFDSKDISLVCAFIFMVFYGISEGMWIFRTSAYNMIVTNFLLLPVALTFFFKYLRKGSTVYLFLCSLLGFTIASVHLLGFMIFLVAVASFYIFDWLFKRKDKQNRLKTLNVILVALLLSSPYIILRLPTLKVLNPYCFEFSFGYKPFYAEILGQNLYYMNPKLLCAPHYHVRLPLTPRFMYIPAFLLTPFLLGYIKRNESALFLFSNMMTPPFILLNPLLVPLMYKAGGFHLVDRITQALPFLLVIGFFFSKFLFKSEKFLFEKSFLSGRKKLRPYFLPVLLAIVLSIALIDSSFNAEFIKLFRDSDVRFADDFKNASKYIPALDYIHDKITESSVFLTGGDYRLTLFLCAYTKHYTVLAGPMDVSVATTDQAERERAARDILDYHVGPKETAALLRKYSVDYVLLDPNQVRAETVKKIKGNPKIFDLIFEKEGLSLFKVKLN